MYVHMFLSGVLFWLEVRVGVWKREGAQEKKEQELHLYVSTEKSSNFLLPLLSP
jgi:hypothetical protein